jgi:hypothetical protein
MIRISDEYLQSHRIPKQATYKQQTCINPYPSDNFIHEASRSTIYSNSKSQKPELLCQSYSTTPLTKNRLISVKAPPAHLPPAYDIYGTPVIYTKQSLLNLSPSPKAQHNHRSHQHGHYGPHVTNMKRRNRRDESLEILLHEQRQSPYLPVKIRSSSIDPFYSSRPSRHVYTRAYEEHIYMDHPSENRQRNTSRHARRSKSRLRDKSSDDDRNHDLLRNYNDEAILDIIKSKYGNNGYVKNSSRHPDNSQPTRVLSSKTSIKSTGAKTGQAPVVPPPPPPPPPPPADLFKPVDIKAEIRSRIKNKSNIPPVTGSTYDAVLDELKSKLNKRKENAENRMKFFEKFENKNKSNALGSSDDDDYQQHNKNNVTKGGGYGNDSVFVDMLKSVQLKPRDQQNPENRGVQQEKKAEPKSFSNETYGKPLDFINLSDKSHELPVRLPKSAKKACKPSTEHTSHRQADIELWKNSVTSSLSFISTSASSIPHTSKPNTSGYLSRHVHMSSFSSSSSSASTSISSEIVNSLKYSEHMMCGENIVTAFSTRNLFQPPIFTRNKYCHDMQLESSLSDFVDPRYPNKSSFATAYNSNSNKSYMCTDDLNEQLETLNTHFSFLDEENNSEYNEEEIINYNYNSYLMHRN